MVDPPTDHYLYSPYSNGSGGFGDGIYWTTYNNVESAFSLVPFYFPTFDLLREIFPSAMTTSNSNHGMNFGNFFISDAASYEDGSLGRVYYIDLGPPQYSGYLFMVLQREGEEFNLIQQAPKPIRIDISNSAPLLTVQDTEDTFNSFFIVGSGVTQISEVLTTLSMEEVRDYRYTLMAQQVDYSGAVVSQAIYVNASGVFGEDLTTFSGFQLLYDIPSGFAERIETSNYTYPGQYIFVTTSGEGPMFFQKDSESEIFVLYSGLPLSRATIIRLDDRL
jgi:hypothetical protein